MIEVELRAKVDKHLIMEKIKNIGAILKGSTAEHDEYFKFSKDTERRLIMRIRGKEGKNKLTFKGSSKLPEDVAWQEWETSIIDEKNLKNLLLSNGLEIVVIIDKKRNSYKYDDFEINVDEIKNLGMFIEVELLTNDAADGKRRVKEFLFNILEIQENDIITKGYVPLMLDAINKN